MPVKIRLIATDIDGTLIRDSTPDLYPEIVEEIRRLTDGGVLFACASGRQYASIRNVFRDVADRILYIAENGAHIRYRNEDLSLTPMKPDDVRELIETLRGIENCEMVVSTPQGSLMETKNRAFLDLMTWGYHNEYRVVDDVLAEKLPILKVSIYRKDSIRELGESSLIPAYADRFQVCVAGEEWVDFMDPTVDKGRALETIRELFDIPRAQTMSFGDNTNDIGLMRAAQESYAVANARPEVREAAKHVCPPWWEKGVWQIVRTIEC
ncbi:MAG: hydrolase [Clostridiales bacterium]|nr:MAG: hydrolase [Clostridiales bacterium]HJA32435.1 HAD family hydrolase [Candidatus Eisenbergiella pullicola]